MVTRIDDMQAYETHTVNVDAVLYNQWRRVHLHMDLPARLTLPALKSMELILEDDCWVLVDSSHYDLPMIAWLNFQDTGRNSLHAPVECTLKYYHYLASQFYEKVQIHISEAFNKYLSEID